MKTPSKKVLKKVVCERKRKEVKEEEEIHIKSMKEIKSTGTET